MSLNSTIFMIIIGCAVVTVLPRIIPFIMIKKFDFPPILRKWLSFIPVCIFTALIMSSVLSADSGNILLHWDILVAIIPTFIVAWWTKSLSITVICGVLTIALFRLFFS